MMICEPLLKTRSRRLTKPDGRIRCSAHLAWIRTLPCSVPGCRSSEIQAHHLLRGPEPTARSLRASDVWCVPLCRSHHDPNSHGSVHHNGDEEGWFAVRGIDPIAKAAHLWTMSPAGQRYRTKNELKVAA